MTLIANILTLYPSVKTVSEALTWKVQAICMTSSGFVLEKPLNIHKSKMYNSITKFSGSVLYPLVGVLILEKACINNFNGNKCQYLALWLDRPIILSSLTAQMWSPTPIRPSSPTAPPFRTDLTTHPQPSSSPFSVKPGWSAPRNWAYWKHV